LCPTDALWAAAPAGCRRPAGGGGEHRGMTGKQRIQAAFAHQPTDRLPCFEQSIASDVATALLGREAYTGTTLLHYQEAAAWMRGDEAHAEFESRLYDDLVAITDALELDMVHVPWRRPQRPALQLDAYSFVYGDPAGDHEIWRFHPGAGTFHRAESVRRQPPSDNPDDLEPGIARMEAALATAVVPTIPDDDWSLRLQRDVGDRLEVCCGGGLSVPLDPLWLMACALRPDLVARYLEVLVERNLLTLQAWAAHGFTIVWGGGDMADNKGPTYGPKVFNELVLPRVQRYVAGLHDLGMKYVYRTDGNLWSIADGFFRESGIDGYGEIDSDAGMSVPEVRARYGQTVTCWGDVPCGSLLHRGTAAEVREFVRRRRDAWDGQGGWILGSSNSIVPGTPPDNLVAMFEAGREDA